MGSYFAYVTTGSSLSLSTNYLPPHPPPPHPPTPHHHNTHTAILALFTSLGVLLDLTSICVLTVYAVIGAGVLWRRYFKEGVTTGKQATLFVAHFVAIITVSICT